MSSMLRRIQRKAAFKTEAAPWQFRPLPDGGYVALHPTRGWKRFSGKRLAAQGRVAQMARSTATTQRANSALSVGWDPAYRPEVQ